MTTAFRLRGAATGLIGLAALGLAACGGHHQATSSDDKPTENIGKGGSAEPADTDPGGDKLPEPPDVRVSYGDEFVDLSAWMYCYKTGCVDGMPASNPPDVGSPGQVILEFPLAGWSFKASFQPAGQQCARSFPAKLTEVEPHRFILHPAGYAGVYDVTLSGRGPGGDTFVTFRWTISVGGPRPSPSSYVGIIADHDGQPDSCGVVMHVSQLAEAPQDQIAATLNVAAANGNTLTFSPHLTRSACRVDGELFLDGPDANSRKRPGSAIRRSRTTSSLSSTGARTKPTPLGPTTSSAGTRSTYGSTSRPTSPP